MDKIHGQARDYYFELIINLLEPLSFGYIAMVLCSIMNAKALNGSDWIMSSLNFFIL